MGRQDNMSSIETSVVDCGGRPARVEVAGEGRDIAIVGSAVPMAWTRPLALSLAELGYRTINFDYSPPGSIFEDSVARTCVEQVADVRSVLAAVGSSAPVLIGMSRGAVTAFAMASRYPDEVGAVVLGFPVAGFGDVLYVEANEEDDPGNLTPEQMLDVFLGTTFSVEFLSTNRQDAVDLVTSPPGSVVRVARDEETPVGDDETVSVPTLIVEGGADQVVLPVHPARLRGVIPHAEYHLFPDASHGFIMEQPSEFASVVAEFLARSI